VFGLYVVVLPGRLLPLLEAGVVFPPGRLFGYTVVLPGRLLPLLEAGAVLPAGRLFGLTTVLPVRFPLGVGLLLPPWCVCGVPVCGVLACG